MFGWLIVVLVSSFLACQSRNFLARRLEPLPASSVFFCQSVGPFYRVVLPFFDCSLVDYCVGVDFSGMSVQKFSDADIGTSTGVVSCFLSVGRLAPLPASFFDGSEGRYPHFYGGPFLF